VAHEEAKPYAGRHGSLSPEPAHFLHS
jgi:hypothetical protein